MMRKKEKAKGVEARFFGSVNIQSDEPNHIYLFGISYKHTSTSKSINKAKVPL